MGTRSNGRRSRGSRRGLASLVSFVLLFAFALGQSSSLIALAEDTSRDTSLPVAEPAEEDGAASVSRSAPSSGSLKTASASRGAGILSHAGLHGGDVNLDFVAAGPFTYDHDTGLGDYPEFGFNDRTISKTDGVVESLEGGDFACDDLVTFFIEVEIEEGAGSGSVALDLSFGAETTGQPGLGFDEIVSYGINTPDDGNVGLNGDEDVTLTGETLDTVGYDEVKGGRSRCPTSKVARPPSFE